MRSRTALSSGGRSRPSMATALCRLAGQRLPGPCKSLRAIASGLYPLTFLPPHSFSHSQCPHDPSDLGSEDRTPSPRHGEDNCKQSGGHRRLGSGDGEHSNAYREKPPCHLGSAGALFYLQTSPVPNLILLDMMFPAG